MVWGCPTVPLHVLVAILQPVLLEGHVEGNAVTVAFLRCITHTLGLRRACARGAKRTTVSLFRSSVLAARWKRRGDSAPNRERGEGERGNTACSAEEGEERDPIQTGNVRTTGHSGEISDGDGDGDAEEGPRLTVSAKTPSQSKSRAAILAFRPTTPPRAGRVDLQEIAAGEEILPNPSEVLKASAPPSPARATSATLVSIVPP